MPLKALGSSEPQSTFLPNASWASMYFTPAISEAVLIIELKYRTPWLMYSRSVLSRDSGSFLQLPVASVKIG